MNERIQELAVEAGLLPREIGPVVETRHMKKKEQDLKKFAELIVKECADTIKSNQWAKDNQAWSKGMQYSAELIKEHFGVEE